MKKSGLSIHCHHNVLVEHCYDYDERVNAIKNKPLNEIDIRLKLFKLLPQEAIDELPKELIKADAERNKACAEWKKACAERKKADAEWKKACAEWEKADAEWQKADQKAWHKKWCGCKNWKNGSIDFNLI